MNELRSMLREKNMILQGGDRNIHEELMSRMRNEACLVQVQMSEHG